jgi:predicted TIM-barrel fold metal-dependent hydrolase
MVCICCHLLRAKVSAIMIDAYTHLDMSTARPLADLEQRMKAAGIDRALVVETWSGDNRGCLQQLMDLPVPAFRIAPCFRSEQEESGAQLLTLETVGALRIKTADLRRLGRTATALESTGKWLLPHAEAGIAALTEELLQLAGLYPGLLIYLPHMGWPRRDKQDDADWLNSILRLSELPNLIVGVSAMAYFSHEAFPHDDVAPFAAHLRATFGPERLVAGSDYPLFEKDRYKQYMQLAVECVRGSQQGERLFASGLLVKPLMES